MRLNTVVNARQKHEAMMKEARYGMMSETYGKVFAHG